MGLEDSFPLIGYRSIAKNLELTADNAEDIAESVLELERHTLDVDTSVMRQIREFTDTVDEMTEMGVRAPIERDYEIAFDVKQVFHEIEDRQREILDNLPEMPNEDVLRVREVIVNLHQTAQYAVRNAEIAANLVLDEDSAHVDIL